MKTPTKANSFIIKEIRLQAYLAVASSPDIKSTPVRGNSKHIKMMGLLNVNRVKDISSPESHSTS
ncbi:MAG: hypothetical protein ACK4K6_08820, partial [Pseudarthrobacter sp.]